jgi:release factor glutamine methyltransferase
MTTIRDALHYGRQQLASMKQSSSQSTRQEAQLLLEQVLHTDRATLYAHAEQVLTAEQEREYFALLQRRLQYEPLSYILGQQEFYGYEFVVDRRVLIPRPETELLVEETLRILRERLDRGRVPLVADIGTGSGAIPITLALEEPHLPTLFAVDISTGALDVARLNCERHNVTSRVHLLHGDLLAPLPEAVDVITANLPYVGLNERDILTPDVYDYEPHLALFSGQQGLDLLQRFLLEVRQEQDKKIHAGAVLLLEIGYRQREPLMAMIEMVLPGVHVISKKDYAGWDRMLQVYL